MTRRTLVFVVLAAALLVISAIVLRGDGGSALADWLKRMHGN
jgi:hypothetical protein